LAGGAGGVFATGALVARVATGGAGSGGFLTDLGRRSAFLAAAPFAVAVSAAALPLAARFTFFFSFFFPGRLLAATGCRPPRSSSNSRIASSSILAVFPRMFRKPARAWFR